MRRLIWFPIILMGCGAELPEWTGQQQGMVIDPFRAQPTQADFDSIAALGASHVALFTWATMTNHTEPQIIRFDKGEGPFDDWSFSDKAFATMANMAKAAGLRLVVLPTFADFADGHWRGEAVMGSEADWTTFFESYREFILHYATLAEKHDAVGFSVGTELRETTHRPEWEQIISDVRGQFHGWITYAANWDDYETVPWWGALDKIGIQAYFELGSPRDSVSAGVRGRPLRRAMQFGLGNAWQPIRDSLASLADSINKSVLFTEIGYKSHTGSTEFPWEWGITGTVDTTLQAEAYTAAFEQFKNETWFDGFYWWKWHPASDQSERTLDFTPQGKPAQEVLKTEWQPH
jgi:hypothetical protein